MSNEHEALAQIREANERVCQARSQLYKAKAAASALNKAYAEAVNNLTLTIDGATKEPPMSLLDQATPDQQPDEEPDAIPVEQQRLAGT